MPSRLSHLFVHVADLERSRTFYVDLLGLEVLMEGGGYLRVGGGDGFHIGLEQRPEVTRTADIEVVVAVADVDATVARIRAAGIAVTDPVAQPWGARHAWLHDPDGTPMSVYAPTDAPKETA